MTLDLTTKATEQFVKFIYGFDIKWCGRNEVLKELLVYGGVYGLGCLQEAAESVLKNRLSSRNVIEFLEFAKEQRLERAVCLCVEFAARNRDKMKPRNTQKLLLKFSNRTQEPTNQNKKKKLEYFKSLLLIFLK